MTATLHQFLPVLAPADAVSGHTLQIDRLLQELGVESVIFTEETHPSLSGRTRSYRDYRGGPVLYQLAIGSAQAELLRTRPDPLAIDYHNLTPVQFFEQWDPLHTHGTRWGRAQLAQLADRCSLALADSPFNRSELDDAGYVRTAVVPILLDTSEFGRHLDEDAERELRAVKAGGGTDWLFVGRVAPNKAQHDVIRAFAAYRRLHDPKARLWLVGSVAAGRYGKALQRLVAALGLERAVTMTGGVSPGRLAAHYRNADVFVCLSDHEGFCVPLLEAMHHRLPIVAFASTAVPDTLGDAGVCLPAKAPVLVAAAVRRVLGDAALRAQLVAAGGERLAAFSLERSRAQFAEAVLPWLEGLGA